MIWPMRCKGKVMLRFAFRELCGVLGVLGSFPSYFSRSGHSTTKEGMAERGVRVFLPYLKVPEQTDEILTQGMGKRFGALGKFHQGRR